MDVVRPDAPQEERSARERLSNLYGLLVLSRLLFDTTDEAAIVALAASTMPTLARCVVEAGVVLQHGSYQTVVGDGPATKRLEAKLRGLDGEERELDLPDRGWVVAFALGTGSRHRGFLVTSAERRPDEHELFLLKALVQQTTAAMINASLRQSDRDQATELRRLYVDIESINAQLRNSIADLERQKRVHEVLNAVAATGTGEAGVATALHEVTGLPVAVEDRFGNLRAWAGPDQPQPYSKPPAARHSDILRQCREASAPIRHGDRLLAVSHSRGEILGAICLVDPNYSSTEFETFALEYASTVLSIELGHQRTLAEAEVRLRRDLVEDLLEGTDNDSAFARAEALGHDLHVPQQVLVLTWRGQSNDDAVLRAVHRVMAASDRDYLVARRPAAAVILAAASAEWDDLYTRLANSLKIGEISLGVGGGCETPDEIPRSYEQARRALAVRRQSRQPDGVTNYAELGVYRILAGGEGNPELEALVQEWLGALLAYDATHRSELVKTLFVHLECGGNYDKTAEALVIHRSTLRYRLQRIRDVSGRDLSDVDNRFNLQVATRAWRILEGS